MRLRIEDILTLLVIFQLLLLSAYQFARPVSQRHSQVLLGCFFLSVGLNIVDGFLVYQGFYFSYPAVALWGPAFALTYGPFLYLYTRSLLVSDFRFFSRSLVHFIPFAALEGVTIAAYVMLSNHDKLMLLKTVHDRQLPAGYSFASLAIFIHFIVYVVLSWRSINKYRSVAHEKFSQSLLANMTELKRLLVFFLIVFLLSTFSSVIQFTLWPGWYFAVFTTIVALLFGFANRLVFAAMNHRALFSIREEELSHPQTPRYASSLLDPHEKIRIHTLLLDWMERQRPFLNPDLSLEELAGQLAIRPRALSQVLNEVTGKTFFDFVNSYRIREAIRLLTNPPDPKITVLEILYQSGFNSKSSFNTLFKKETGLTPTAYKALAARPSK